MFHIVGQNNLINQLHERCFRMKCFSHEIIYSDKKSNFLELLEKDNSVSIHKQNLHFLAIDMFKFKIFAPCTN